ncbi:MAG: hypothetical protein H0W46_06890 [Acidimicrobiia bacterium]|nr:hypothetical protein [Acidimicrobiia bacterium]
MANVLALLGIPSAAVAEATAMLAHQGGWDEILLALAPIVVGGGLLWLAKRRLVRAQREDPTGTRSMAAPTARNRPTKSS